MSLRLVVAALLLPLVGGAAECRDDLNEADGYTIRSVRVEGRWVPPIALPIKPGDRFSNAKVRAAMQAVRDTLRGEGRQEFELANLGSVGVLHITRCLLVEGREVDVIIQPRSLQVDLFEVGGNVLPIPRAPFATFYQAVPKPILELHPLLGAYQDKEYGFAGTGAIDGRWKLRETSQLRIAADGRKSFEHSFYDANAAIDFASIHPGELLEQLGVEARYLGSETPQADNSYLRQSGTLGFTTRLRPRAGVIQTLLLGANYQFSSNRFTDDDQREDANEHKVQLRALIEGKAGDAFVRAAMWSEAAWPDRGSSYGRIAAMAAVEKEFLLGKNQTIGVEAIAGAGRTWSAPSYADFYGGNSERNFLYDSFDSSALARFPNGPLLRSFGEGQAGGRGSSGYWHLNLNVSLPIPWFSAPLIPDEEAMPGLSLKRLLKNKASDSVAYYAVQLENEGFAPEEALARARAMYGEVRPAIEFIADRANVYSLKPLLLFDLAGRENQRLLSAFGGGLQLTIVTARMEVGYMETLSESGNFFARIVFQNIF